MTKNKYALKNKAVEYAKMSWPELNQDIGSEPFYSWLASLLQRIPNNISATEKILEVGFGAGRILYELAILYPKNNIIGSEFSTAMSDITSQILLNDQSVLLDKSTNIKGKSLKNISLNSNQSIEDLTFYSNESFYITVCINVLDRVESTTSAINELIRVTKIGGNILIVHAFDYEDSTPKQEQLSKKDFIQFCKKNGLELIYYDTSELKKNINNMVSVFNESAFIFTKY